MNTINKVVLAAAACTCTAASGQVVLHEEDYEDGNFQGWLVNGQNMSFPGQGNPGVAGGVPLLDFFFILLHNEQNGSPMLGDLSRHGGPLRFGVDIRTLGLFNFFGNPMDPRIFPVTFELVDIRPGPFPVVSVYITVRGMPPVQTGWERFEFEIPDPTQAALPAGWGGTGDEDPVTFMPRLPPGVTYASVLSSVDQIRVTTMQPGYVYAASFWEVRFDNIRFERLGVCGDLDFNNDGLFPDTQDIDDLLMVFSGGPCSVPSPFGCDTIDFNRDGIYPDTQDIEDFLRVFAGGTCP